MDLNTLPASGESSSAGDLCNEFGPRSDLDPNCLTLCLCLLKKLILKKIQQTTKFTKRYPACME